VFAPDDDTNMVILAVCSMLEADEATAAAQKRRHIGDIGRQERKEGSTHQRPGDLF
jgi:hypothetical protein